MRSRAVFDIFLGLFSVWVVGLNACFRLLAAGGAKLWGDCVSENRDEVFMWVVGHVFPCFRLTNDREVLVAMVSFK